MSEDIDIAEVSLFNQSEACGGGWLGVNPILVIDFGPGQADQYLSNDSSNLNQTWHAGYRLPLCPTEGTKSQLTNESTFR